MKHFESDVSSMFKWISDNMDLFLSKCSSIGRESSETINFQQEHENFYRTSMQSHVHVMRLREVAERLSSCNPYAAGRVTVLYNRLERSFLEFKSCLEERTHVLQLAHMFYQKAESFNDSVRKWSQEFESNAGDSSSQSDVTRLEQLVHRHQDLFQNISTRYEEIHEIQQKLKHQLHHFITYVYQSKFAIAGQQQSQSPQQQQQLSPSQLQQQEQQQKSDSTKHVKSMMDEVNSKYRAIDSIWQMRRLKLHQKLALALFQDDVRQVIDWIDVHGEGFLRKNMTIGRNLARARQLQKSHQHFEAVAANTYTNGEKLLAAAAEFAQTGECNPDEIHRVAELLRNRVTSFAEKVERRRIILNLAAMFFTHEKEITTCMDQLRSEASGATCMQAPVSVDACEVALHQVSLHKDQLNSAIKNTIAEGETLINFVRGMMDGIPHEDKDISSNRKSTDSERTESPNDSTSRTASSAQSSLQTSMNAIQQIMERLDRSRSDVDDLCNNRKLKMELCLQLRVFERDALVICNQFEEFAEEIDNSMRMETAAAVAAAASASNSGNGSGSSNGHAVANKNMMLLDVTGAEKTLQQHNETFTRVQQMAYDFFQRGQELAQVRNEGCMLSHQEVVTRDEPAITGC